MIQEIETKKLRRHPKNVRQSYDGIEELAASIKERGILQNLTVVLDPADEGYYLVVIGNRRLEAAREAGLKTCPCTVSDMSESEQISTMLLENMQRSDLTIVEEIKGVQLCLDLGMTEEELAKKTGLSKKTIKDRKKVADMGLDYGKVDGQIRIGDLVKLAQIKDSSRRQQAFEKIGTNNFDYAVSIAIGEEKEEKWRAEMRKKLSFAKEVKGYSGRRDSVNYLRKGDKIPEPEEGWEYSYFFAAGMCYLYGADLDAAEEEDERKREKQRQREKEERDEAEFKEIAKRMFEARKRFMEETGHAPLKLDAVGLLKWMTWCAVFQYDPEADIYHELKEEKDNPAEIIDPDAAMEDAEDEYKAAALIYSMLEVRDRITCKNWRHEYDRDDRHMDTLYFFLTELGYVMSDEEKEVVGGTHRLYRGAQR